MTTIIISNKRDNESKMYNLQRPIELNKLKVKEIHELIDHYGIIEIHKGRILKSDLISGIISFEKMMAGGKQTQLVINIDNKTKSYFVETKTKLIFVKKSYTNTDTNKIKINMSHIETYTSTTCLFKYSEAYVKNYYVEKENNKIRFRWDDDMGGNVFNLTDLTEDLNVCRKAIFFIESLHFYLKVKYLLRLFSDNNDIIKYICFIYFERTLQNVSDIRCKLQ